MIFNPDYQTAIDRFKSLLDSLRTVYNDLGTPTSQICQLVPGAQRFSFLNDEGNLHNQLFISPNLVTNSFLIRFENRQNVAATLRVFDYLNHEIVREDSGSTSFLEQLDCSSWSDGIYLIAVEQFGSTASQKLVVSR